VITLGGVEPPDYVQQVVNEAWATEPLIAVGTSAGGALPLAGAGGLRRKHPSGPRYPCFLLGNSLLDLKCRMMPLA
jgi:hypothetical protein